MPTLLAIVDSATGARTAAAAGAGRIALRCKPDDADLVGLGHALPIPLSLVAAESSGSDPWASALRASGADDLRWPATAPVPILPDDLKAVTITAFVLIDRNLTPNLVEELAAAGFRGLMLAAPTGSALHLTGRFDSQILGAIVSEAKRLQLRISLSGGLEAPDVPRLLAFAPDEIGFELASSSVAKLGSLQDLIAVEAESTVRLEADEPDRIFVHEWVFPMSIGAYARERGTPQRVRLSVEAESVEAESARRSSAASDMRDVVSYDLITDTVRRLAATHVDLVETFAERIAEALLTHRALARVTVTVEKLDLGTGAVGCRIVRRRAT